MADMGCNERLPLCRLVGWCLCEYECVNVNYYIAHYRSVISNTLDVTDMAAPLISSMNLPIVAANNNNDDDDDDDC